MHSTAPGRRSYDGRMVPWWLRIVIVVVILAVLAAGALIGLDQFARQRAQNLDALATRQITLHDKPLTLLVADQPSTVGPGLSGQERLPDDQGLLLVSPDGDTQVTMLGMLFALDVIWIDADNRVVAVQKDVPARPFPLSYSSPTAAAAVLELTAGGVDRYEIEVGDIIDDTLLLR